MLKKNLLITLLFCFSIFVSRKTVRAEIKNEIGSIAKSINVKIFTPYSDATGVLVKKDSNKYLVLTAWHALDGIRKGDSLEVETNDGVIHTVLLDSIEKIENVDLGILNFESSNKYKIANLGIAHDSKLKDKVYVFGFPIPSSSIEISIARLQPGQITGIQSRYNKDGYQIIYDNLTLPGMSGGSVLDKNGKLIGIHGRSEKDETISVGANKLVSTGNNMGIPITYFKNHISKKPTILEKDVSTSASDFLFDALNLVNKEDEALRMLLLAKKSVKINPNPLGFTLIGVAQERLGDPDSALENYKKALDLSPNIELANKFLAPKVSPKDAIDIYGRLIKNYPKKNEYLYLRAMSKHKNGDLKGSLEDLEKGIKTYQLLKNSYCKDYKYAYSVNKSLYEKCMDLEKFRNKSLERAANTYFVLNNTKKSCPYWQKRLETFWGSTMWEDNYYWRGSRNSIVFYNSKQEWIADQPDYIKQFIANNDNFNIERAIEMESNTFSRMDLSKYLYKYCLDELN